MDDDNYGAKWLRSNGKTVSDFGAKVAGILNTVFRGIYHADTAILRADWAEERWIEVNIYADLATWDGNLLTMLVILCHDESVRMEIGNGGPYRTKLRFHPREREDGISRRHPTIEDAISSVRARHWRNCQESAEVEAVS